MRNDVPIEEGVPVASSVALLAASLPSLRMTSVTDRLAECATGVHVDPPPFVVPQRGLFQDAAARATCPSSIVTVQCHWPRLRRAYVAVRRSMPRSPSCRTGTVNVTIGRRRSDRAARSHRRAASGRGAARRCSGRRGRRACAGPASRDAGRRSPTSAAAPLPACRAAVARAACSPGSRHRRGSRSRSRWTGRTCPRRVPRSGRRPCRPAPAASRRPAPAASRGWRCIG